jgi:hypothetical protein
LVIFAIYTLAPTYRVGLANRGEGTDLDALAKNAAVSRKHQIGLPPGIRGRVPGEYSVWRSFASRVLDARCGLDKTGHTGEKPSFHDSYIAVLLIPQKDRTLIAVAQDDNWKGLQKESDEAWINSLKKEVQSFVSTMTMP